MRALNPSPSFLHRPPAPADEPYPWTFHNTVRPPQPGRRSFLPSKYSPLPFPKNPIYRPRPRPPPCSQLSDFADQLPPHNHRILPTLSSQLQSNHPPSSGATVKPDGTAARRQRRSASQCSPEEYHQRIDPPWSKGSTTPSQAGSPKTAPRADEDRI